MICSRPATHRAMKALPRAAPSGTATTSTGRPVAVGERLHPRRRPCVPPPVATMRRGARPASARQVEVVADDEAGRLVGGRPAGAAGRGGARRRGAPPAGRGGAAASARRGRRAATPAGRSGSSAVDGRGPATAPTQRRTRSRNSPPALLGPPISVLPGAVCGMVHSPGTSVHSSITPHVMRVAPQMTSTSPVLVGAGDELLAEGVDRPAADQGARRRERRRAPVRRARRPATMSGSAPASCRPRRRGPRPSRRSRTAGGRSSPWSCRWRPCPCRAWLATAWAGQ